MKKEGESSAESPHIIVTEVPPGFLKRRNVRSHFLRFGTIVRMSIQNSFCVITFESHEQARDAVLHGTHWKDMPLKIDFTPAHDPFGTDEAIINEELNWFAENTDFSDKPKTKSSKSTSQFRFSDVPPKKLIKVDLFDDDETSKSSEDSRPKGRWSDENKSKSSERRKSASSRFLQGIRTQLKSEEVKRVRCSEELKTESKPSEGDKRSSGTDEFKMKSKLVDESKPTPMLVEDFQFAPKSTDECSVSSFSQERLVFKPKISNENRQSSRPFEEFKSNSRFADEDKLFEDYMSKSKYVEEGKTSSKLFEDFKFTSSFAFHDNKSNSKFLEESKPYPSKFSDGGDLINIPEIKPNLEIFDTGSQPEEKARPKSSNENKISDENKQLLKSSEDSKLLIKTSDSPFQNRVAITLQDKLNILEERDRQIRMKSDKTSRFESSIQGTCPDMCPEKERVLRELMGIIAPYESLNDGRMDHSKAVKEYARSSADQEEPLPHDLRPEPVLTMTMTYLINCIIARIDEIGEENQSNWYDFCWGRLRAIRKDIIQQQLCDRSTVVILEQCARFHIACYDRLWGTSKSQFDDKINTETLVNCLQSLIHMYEDLQREGVSCPNEAEFNAYLILLKINSGFLMSEYQSYSTALKESKLVKEAVKIHLAYNNNMYSTFFKLAKQTSYLNTCLMQRFFQQVRIQALNTTVKAHCVPNKSSNISVQFMMDILKLDSSDDCISFCESMGLSFVEEEKSFKVSRNYFYITDNIYTIETPSSIVLNKRMPIAEAVVSDKPTLPIYLNHTVHNSFTEEGLLKENALDASDQEEKMLRDDIERKLLVSQLKQTFSHKLQKDESEDFSQSAIEDESAKMGIKESFIEEGQEEKEEIQFREKEDYSEDVMDSRTEPTSTVNSLLEESSSEEAERSDSDIVFPKKPPPLLLHSPELIVSKEFVSPMPSPFQVPSFRSKTPSPRASFSLEKNPFLPIEQLSSSGPPLSTPKLNSPMKSEIVEPFKYSNPFLKSPECNPKSPKHFHSKEHLSVGTKLSKKHDKQKLYMDKLRKKLSENMKRVSARKYLRIWKEKTLKLKSSSELEAMMLYNMTVKEYIKLWGKPPLQRSHNLAKRLSTRKNANLMVQMILHTDILDKVDKNVNKIGKAVINTLGATSIKQAEKWGNIAQPNPVFWKVVFALPEPPEGGTTFSSKLRTWCKAAFYTRQDSQLSEAELHLSELGVPVCVSVCVVEGLTQLEPAANLTALVIVRARHWETTTDSESRLQKLLSFKNNPIPVAILNVGQQIDLLNINNSTGITHFEQCLWDNSRTIKRVLCNLAHHVYLYNLKVKPFCSVVEVFSEKLLDSIQQDSYFHDGLDEALLDPNNIIYFYNYLVDKLEEEIIHCKIQNYFGTAYEFREDLKRCQSSLVFPDNYNDVNFERSLSHRCLRSKLRPMDLTDFKDRKAAILFLKNYCDDLGCPSIVKQLVRLLRLPDEDVNVDLQSHLRSVHWLSFIEIVIKEILTSHLLSFKVVYREDVIQNVIDSHFWFNTKIIEKKR